MMCIFVCLDLLEPDPYQRHDIILITVSARNWIRIPINVMTSFYLIPINVMTSFDLRSRQSLDPDPYQRHDVIGSP